MRLNKLLLFVSLVPLAACDYNEPADYDARAEYREFLALKEQKAAEAANSKEKLDPAVAKMEEAKKTFSTYCATCHGPDGKAATPTALAMQPNPRNLTDSNWQASVDDAHIAKVIKEGGASVGLSATMTAWGGVLNDEQVDSLVKLVRSLKE